MVTRFHQRSSKHGRLPIRPKLSVRPLEPGKPRHRDAGETDAGANRGHAVGELNAVKADVGFPATVAGCPVEVVTEAWREVERRPVDF